MTRREFTGKRDLTFSGWIRDNLPSSSTGLMVSDLDFILENYHTKKIMLLEIKTRNCQVKQWQRILFNNLHRWIAKGMDRDWKYLGFHCIRFQNTFFNNGKVYLDNKESSEEKIRSFLSI